jgi:hypothetical protein
LEFSVLNFSILITPLDFDLGEIGFARCAEAKMNFGAAPARMSAAAVDLRNSLCSVSES